MHIGQESSLILPMVLDDNGENAVKFEVISTTGKKSYDVDQIIRRYTNEIIAALYANSLVTGQDGGGSMALSESQIKIRDDIIESFLAEIADVFNHYLIPRIFKWNGWEVEEYPKFAYGKVSPPSLEQMSSAGQRFGAVGLIPRTAETINYISSLWGNPYRFDEDATSEEIEKLLGQNESKAGSGMAEGMPNGTGSGNNNNSKTNSGNKA